MAPQTRLDGAPVFEALLRGALGLSDPIARPAT